jgi:hypothetical protein
MPRVVLVTGSRSLVHRAGAEQWARAILEPILEGCDHVIEGGASGPDYWAWDTARKRGIGITEYRVDGRRWRWIPGQPIHTGSWESLGRWDPPRDYSGPIPLVRNASMVNIVSDSVLKGWDAIVVGLIDPKSETHGTEHTTGLAKRAIKALTPAMRASMVVREERWRP